MILFAQNRGPKAELQCTIKDKRKKTQYEQKQSLKYNNRQQRKQGQTVKQASKEENRKQEVQLWELAVD